MLSAVKYANYELLMSDEHNFIKIHSSELSG